MIVIAIFSSYKRVFLIYSQVHELRFIVSRTMHETMCQTVVYSLYVETPTKIVQVIGWPAISILAANRVN